MKVQFLLLLIIQILLSMKTPPVVSSDDAFLESIDLSSLQPHEIAILQYDSRDVTKVDRSGTSYWHAAAKWNKHYCDTHGHIFLYYTIRSLVLSSGDQRKRGKMKKAALKQCYYDGNQTVENWNLLATPWCKVKAMINANEDHPYIKFFIYMDSDAVIDRAFANIPLNKLISVMQHNLQWDPEMKPIVFNQDGPCWWCSLVMNVGYNMCLNAGTVAWYRHPLSEMVLHRWWDASMDSELEGNPIRRRFRLKWPWEQDRQMAVYNSSSQHIQVASQPQRPHMVSNAGLRSHSGQWLQSDSRTAASSALQGGGWCLSHLPGSGCFISHFCADSHSKQLMKKKYAVAENGSDERRKRAQRDSVGFQVHYLSFSVPFQPPQ